MKNETSRKRITTNRTEMNFSDLPDPVAIARGSDTPCDDRGYCISALRASLPGRYRSRF